MASQNSKMLLHKAKNYEQLSDVELRAELQICGFPNIPITETTRKLLIKRLKKYALENSSKERHNRKSAMATRYENGLHTNSQTWERSSPHDKKRTTSEYSPQHASTSFYDSYLSNDDTLPFLGQNISNSYTNDYGVKKRTPAKIHVSPVIIDDSQTTNTYNRETPSVVSRLLKLRDTTIKRNHNSVLTGHLYLHDSDSESSTTPKIAPNFKNDQRPMLPNVRFFRTLRSSFKQSSVPYLLISLFGLFFIVLSLLYIRKPPDLPSTMIEKSTTFTTCEEFKQLPSSSGAVRPFINCIEIDMLSNAMSLNHELIQILQTIAEQHFCQDTSISPELSGADFLKYIYKKRSKDAHNLLRTFHAAMYLIEKNPQWKITVTNKSVYGQQKAAEDVLPDIYKHDLRFRLLRPHLPLKCVIWNKLQRFFYTIGTLFLVSLSMLLFFAVYRFFQSRKENRERMVEYFTKEIIREVAHRTSLNDEESKGIIITHLRDKLISTDKKQAMLWAWNEALRNLEDTDSRIQFGTTLHNGEEFRTMKWVESLSKAGTTPTNLQENVEKCGRKKQWQSPAFGNVNNCFEPPTPCLKIRHMFDIDEANDVDLKQNVIDSILEKVGSRCRIYDVQLDRQSCCVYIRCASEKDAGIIHNEINGWWFDNRLVSIKFLRLQRYLARFPCSPTFPTLMTTKRNTSV